MTRTGHVSGLQRAYVACVGPTRGPEERTEIMDALQVLQDIVSLCEQAPMDQCPHVVLEHVTRHENEAEAEYALLTLAGETLQVAQMTGQDPTPALAHIVVFALATGYALGASDAYDVTISAEVIVPDTLADIVPERD